MSWGCDVLILNEEWPERWIKPLVLMRMIEGIGFEKYNGVGVGSIQS